MKCVPEDRVPLPKTRSILITTIHATVEQDQQVTVAEIEHYFREFACDALSHGTVLAILHDHLSVRKLCSRWIPKLLDDEHMKNRMAASLDFLFHYHADDEDFLDRIVTGDEKWVHHYTPERRKIEAMGCRRRGSS